MMDDDNNVCSLIELVFLKEDTPLSEFKANYPDVPPCLLTSDFLQSWRDVMTVRRTMLNYRWRKYFDICSCKMLDTFEMYVRCIMYACLKEHECRQNIFDSFISICALVSNLSDETLRKTGREFNVLDPIIVMEFYRFNLRDIFYRNGGFQRLVEHICSHRYLELKLQEKDLVLLDDPSAPSNHMYTFLAEKFHEELKRERICGMVISLDEVVNDARSYFMAQALMRTVISSPLSTKLRRRNLVRTPVENREKEDEAAEKSEASKGACQGLNSDPETTSTPRHKDSTVRYENIIQAVIKYNHSKSSAKKNASDRFQEEAGGILDRLKHSIKSLDELLGGYDKE